MIVFTTFKFLRNIFLETFLELAPLMEKIEDDSMAKVCESETVKIEAEGAKSEAEKAKNEAEKAKNEAEKAKNEAKEAKNEAEKASQGKTYNMTYIKN